MRKGDGYTVFFAAIVCIVCSLMLSAASSLLRERQEEQAELDRKINVLRAFGVAVRDADGKKIAPDEVNRVFSEHISDMVIDRETGLVIPGASATTLTRDEIEKKQKLPLYEWREGGEVTKYAFPVSGKGLWSTIYGYLALERDLSTIVGITFYRHGETPGLGGEIEADWFQQQFRGKKVYVDGELQRFEIVKGKVQDRYPKGNDHAVDGISGASLTGKGINQFLNEDLSNYERYFSTIRKG